MIPQHFVHQVLLRKVRIDCSVEAMSDNQWTIKVKIVSHLTTLSNSLFFTKSFLRFVFQLIYSSECNAPQSCQCLSGIDNEAINSKKGSKWKAGDDLTLQIEGHAQLGYTDPQRRDIIVTYHDISE